MSSLGVKRRRRNPHTSPYSSPSQPNKMDNNLIFPSTESLPCLPDRRASSDGCCVALTQCMDERCRTSSIIAMDEFCQACFEDQECQDPACHIQCDECCDNTCTDGLCSTQVKIRFEKKQKLIGLDFF